MVSRQAVFLDRDGVINEPVVRAGKPYPPASLSEFRILPGVAEACHRLKAAGFLLVVATNQPDVGRGNQTLETLEAMHRSMCKALPIDHVETCLHSGWGVPCLCRKPSPGMLLHAASLLEIDLQRSYMVGDRWRDIDCGAAAGCMTFFVDHGYDESLRMRPTFVVKSLSEAAGSILGSSARM